MEAIIRHTIKPDRLDEHLELLRAAQHELHRLSPPDFTWTVYRVDGTRTFVEYTAGANLPQPLPTLPAFRRYRAGLDDRREGPGKFQELEDVASYRNP